MFPRQNQQHTGNVLSRAAMRFTGLLLTLVTVFPLLAADADPLADMIDRQLEAAQRDAGIVPSNNASDAEFLRRVTLDLAGRIPTVDEVTTFLAEASPQKRSAVIDGLLAGEDHRRHFAQTWRALLLPEAETNGQLRYLVPGFERWLREFRDSGSSFAELVRQLVTVPITGTSDRPQLVLTDLQAANRLAYLVSKEADPAKLAADVTRVFLGIRLECAQCHDHPFDTWTQEQFWNQAAFFAGVQRRGRGPFAPLFEQADVLSISLMGKEQQVPALFLDGETPAFTQATNPRTTLADWITQPENPFFARAIVNRVWSQLMGPGLVDPIDDMGLTNPASHPELLDTLAEQWTASGFDIDFLYRAICNSRAYQRSSRQTDPSQAEARSYAKMAVRALSGEQIYDSVALAVGWTAEHSTADRRGERGGQNRRNGFVAIFGTSVSPGDPQTSVTQSLALMNGALVNAAVTPETSPRLQQLATDDALSDSQRIAGIFLATLSRHPTDDELQTGLSYLQQGDREQLARRLGDLLWVTLNSPEFRWNH